MPRYICADREEAEWALHHFGSFSFEDLMFGDASRLSNESLIEQANKFGFEESGIDLEKELEGWSISQKNLSTENYSRFEHKKILQTINKILQINKILPINKLLDLQ